MSKSILVTGAFGQIGKRCVQYLLERDCTVVGVDLYSKTGEAVASQLGKVDSGALVTAYLDLLDASAVVELLARHEPDVIIHLAAICSPPCYLDPDFATLVNVDATRYLVNASLMLAERPVFVFASSSAVYGSRNPYSHPEGITGNTSVAPIECYGRDKVVSEQIIEGSGLDYAILRLAGVVSPDGLSNMRGEYLLLTRATPGDNRVHAVDARDAALAFANAAFLERPQLGRVFLVGGNATCKKSQREIEDDVMQAIGIGRLGEAASLPGDPNDDLGWSFTDWYDTASTEAVLQFQKHDWSQTVAWVADGLSPNVRRFLYLISPLLRGLLRFNLRVQKKREKRGQYADPWALIGSTYGQKVLVGRSNTD